MPKKQDWLEIIEKASELKKGTKLPKNFDVDSLVMLMYRAPQRPTDMSWNTGAGANGVVEPDKPVALDTRTSPPSVYHEGEPVQEFPGGRNITPAGVVPAQTEQQQMGLGRMQQERRYPGFQTGGTVYDDPYGTTATRPTNTLSLSPQGSTFQSGVDQAFDTTKQRAAGNDPLMRNISNRALQDYDTRAAVSDTMARQYTASDPYATLGAKRAVVAKQDATYRAGLSGLVGDLSEKAMTRSEQANTQLYNMGREQVQDELSTQKWEKTFGEGQYQTDLGQGNWQKGFDFEKQKYGDQEFARMAEDAQSTDFATWQKKYPTATQADYNTAREYRTRQLQAMDTANLTASESLNQLRKSDKWNEAQEFLKAGDFRNYAATVKSITGKDINFTDFVEDRDYLMATRGQNLEAGDIANDAARLGLDVSTMNAVIQAANNGYAADMINNQLGTNLFQNEVDAIAEKYRQGITSGNIELDRLRNSLGDAEYGSIQDMINGGSSLEAVNARLATQGKTGLTLPEFESMLSATPLSERNWGRKMTYANMLLQSQDPENLTQASRIFGDMFPGTTFDVGQIISDIGAERFAKGMTDMATLANTFKSWGEAASSVQGLNLMNSMGIDDTTAAQMFQGLKLNAIDQEWDVFENSEFFQNLDEEGKENIRNTFEKGLTGELEFDIKPVYNITDSNGQFVKSFDNIVDANKFLGDNADKAYMVKEASNYVYKNMATGDTVVVNNGTGEATSAGSGVIPSQEGKGTDKPVGSVYIDGKRVYEVGAGGAISEISIDDTTDLWSSSVEKILNLGKENNPYYNKIIDSRADQIVSGEHPVTSKITNADLLNAIKSATADYTVKGDVKVVEKPAPIPFAEPVKVTWGSFTSPPMKGTTVKIGGITYSVTSDPIKDEVNVGEKIYLTDITTGDQSVLYASSNTKSTKPTFTLIDKDGNRTKL